MIKKELIKKLEPYSDDAIVNIIIPDDNYYEIIDVDEDGGVVSLIAD